MKKILLLSVAVAGALTLPLHADKPRLVLLPFGNLSGVERANAAITPSLALKLTGKGWDVVRGEEVEDFLLKERIRYVDSLSSDLLRKLLGNSVASLSARMVRGDGSIAWTAVTGLTSDETEGLLGLGRAGALPALSDRTLSSLLRKFPAPGERATTEPRTT